jgi:tRNA-splicing endonuclease subunit Sen34
MSTPDPEPTIRTQIPISYIPPKYLIFSPSDALTLRRSHNITGVLIGSIPQTPQQNVFQGLPLLLLPEEAKLLVEKGFAFIVDERKAHDEFESLREEEKKSWLRQLEREGREIGKVKEGRKEVGRERGLEREMRRKLKQKESERGKKKDKETEVGTKADADGDPEMGRKLNASTTASDDVDLDVETSLFNSRSQPARPFSPTPSSLSISITSTSANYIASITPHTSYPPLTLPTPPQTPSPNSILVPPSYPLFCHLHSLGYFLSPGLRFGCQYLVYPGDPLRFHSHFLAVGKEWNEAWDVMEVVGGGRLGTGVKKGFLIGGEVDEEGKDIRGENGKEVRCFSIEWAAM